MKGPDGKAYDVRIVLGPYGADYPEQSHSFLSLRHELPLTDLGTVTTDAWWQVWHNGQQEEQVLLVSGA